MNSRLIVITGISGAGKSTALKAFEDLGFSCVDNLPAPLINGFVDFLLDADAARGSSSAAKSSPENREDSRRFALLVDCRDEGSFPYVWDAMERLKAVGTRVDLLFFDCRDEAVIRRFRETRRPHPLLLGGATVQTVAEALARERELLADFREAAVRVFDTTVCSPHDLRRQVEEYCGHEHEIEVFVVSFGYKHGLPYDADLLVDVRFLPNPHFVPELREMTGREQEVQEFIFSYPDARAFVDQYMKLLQFLIPKYQAEGKRYLTIGVGCTGGRHRSVAISLRLLEELERGGLAAAVRHRDLDSSTAG